MLNELDRYSVLVTLPYRYLGYPCPNQTSLTCTVERLLGSRGGQTKRLLAAYCQWPICFPRVVRGVANSGGEQHMSVRVNEVTEDV